MARKPKQTAAEMPEDSVDVIAEEIVVAEPVKRDLSVGDRVTLSKDGAKAIVTNAFNAEGTKKQTRIEVQREDNGSVVELWVDEVRR